MSNNFVMMINNGPIPPVDGAVIYTHTDADGDLWYKVLDNEKEMTYEEMKNLYTGYHVYVTNCVVSVSGKLIKGIPRIISNTSYGGAFDGIYDKYDAEEYGDDFDLWL